MALPSNRSASSRSMPIIASLLGQIYATDNMVVSFHFDFHYTTNKRGLPSFNTNLNNTDLSSTGQ